MVSKHVDVTMTSSRGLVVIEDVPVNICEKCQEQYYDEDVSMKLQKLISRGFPKNEVVREIVVPVYTLGTDVVRQLPENIN